MTEQSKEVTLEDIDLMVYFDYEPAQDAIIHLAPEDCQPGFGAKCTVNSVYLMLSEMVESEVDISDLLSDTVLTDLENKILENT